jgi:hypothetical protein
MTNLALRPLTHEEEKFLRWILEHGTEVQKTYLPQIEGMRARSSCTCGCPSIALVVMKDAPVGAPAKDRIVADLSGQSPEGVTAGILLFQDDGKLSELELYPNGDAGEFGLPTIESLAPFECGKPMD